MTRPIPCHLTLIVFMFAVILVNGDFFVAFKSADGDEDDVDYTFTCIELMPPPFVKDACDLVDGSGHRRCFINQFYTETMHKMDCEKNPVGSKGLYFFRSTKNGPMITCAGGTMMDPHDDRCEQLSGSRDWSCLIDADEYEKKKQLKYCREQLEVPHIVYYVGYRKGNIGVKYEHACFGSPPPFITDKAQTHCEYIYTAQGDLSCFIDAGDILPGITLENLKFCRKISVVPKELLRIWYISFRYDKSGWGHDLKVHLMCEKKPVALFKMLDEQMPEVRHNCERGWKFAARQFCHVHTLYKDEFLTEYLKKHPGCIYVYKQRR